MNKFKFQASISLSPTGPYIDIDFSINAKDETTLVYDDVELAALDEIEKKYSETDFPNLKLIQIYIQLNDKELYPVLPESKKDDIDKLFNNYCKVLVLPEYKYTLTPEYKLYLKLCEAGIISPDTTPFNHELFHSVLIDPYEHM